MPGKHQVWLQKDSVVLTVAALAMIVIMYGVSHFLGS